ncbi:hypothetical protein [Bullifex sp.]|uniref:hypothetical protein n=1 Tax=Bullifex sp. TaxID=2815808 RepID=UPI002A81EC94|nr:hypothetical protein [Bullifex sp.]MDY4066456.1 hypothetical protein [Bullifex sp.]
MRKSLIIVVSILSLFILFSCNNGIPEAPATKTEFKGKTFTIDLSPESRTIGEKGILSLIISEDEKSLEWVLSEPKADSGFNVYSGTFEDITITKDEESIKITSSDELSIELQFSESGYSIKSEGKLNEIVINTTAKVTLSTISDTSKIDSFIGHQFWFANPSTAGLLVIEKDQISYKYYSNYLETEYSWSGDEKIKWDCENFEIQGNYLICIIPEENPYYGTYKFKILNANQLLLEDTEIDNIKKFNIVK